MAFSDFKITKFSGNTDNGTAILHSSLSNPITGAGDFCRGFNTDPFNRSNTKYNFSVSSSYNNGSLIGVQQNKSLSIRAMIRHESTRAQGQSIHLYAKTADNFGQINGQGQLFHPRYSLYTNVGWSGCSDPSCYFTTLRLQCGGYRSGEMFNVDLLHLPANQWHRIRMDVIPATSQQMISGVLTTSDYKDVIDIYTGSGPVGSETWGKIYTKEILTTDAEYVPWGNYISPGGAGGYIGTITSSVGFLVASTSTSTAVYVDQFQVYTASL